MDKTVQNIDAISKNSPPQNFASVLKDGFKQEKWKRFLVKGVYNVSFIADGNMLSVEKLTIVK